jgi:hypothetical protein
MIDIKLFFALAATCIGVYSFVPYIRDILAGTTKPHVYTWLIWTITQGIATAGVWAGHGGWSQYGLAIGTCFVGLIFVMALRYGTKDITLFDTSLLVGALAGIAVWYFTANIFYAVILATLVDFVGYFPSFRKTWADHASETKSMWVLWVISGVCSLLGLENYNVLTTLYIGMCLCMNTIMMVLVFRRADTRR